MKRLLQTIFFIGYIVAFLIPGYTFFVNNKQSTSILFSGTLDQAASLLILFRFFGLYAFTLVWSQIMLGAFRIPLTKLYGSRILKLHITFGVFTLGFATLHPLLFYTGYWMLGTLPLQALEAYLGNQLYVYGLCGVIAWTFMLTTVTTALLRKRPFMANHWRKIHYANYFVFMFSFIHSFKIGTEVQLQPLNLLYLFFGVTFITAVLYKRLVPLWKKITVQAPSPANDNISTK